MFGRASSGANWALANDVGAAVLSEATKDGVGEGISMNRRPLLLLSARAVAIDIVFPRLRSAVRIIEHGAVVAERRQDDAIQEVPRKTRLARSSDKSKEAPANVGASFNKCASGQILLPRLAC
jgi:hypothetical protein